MTPSEIKQARKDANLTQQKSADLVHVSKREWQRYEEGTRNMPRSRWELYLIKTNVKA